MTQGIVQWRIGDVAVTTLNEGFNQTALEVI
jgi:hypothetical protein